jgi:hypothetical protein
MRLFTSVVVIVRRILRTLTCLRTPLAFLCFIRVFQLLLFNIDGVEMFHCREDSLTGVFIPAVQIAISKPNNEEKRENRVDSHSFRLEFAIRTVGALGLWEKGYRMRDL